MTSHCNDRSLQFFTLAFLPRLFLPLLRCVREERDVVARFKPTPDVVECCAVEADPVLEENTSDLIIQSSTGPGFWRERHALVDFSFNSVNLRQSIGDWCLNRGVLSRPGEKARRLAQTYMACAVFKTSQQKRLAKWWRVYKTQTRKTHLWYIASTNAIYCSFNKAGRIN